MRHTHDIPEWLAYLSLGSGLTAAALILWLLLIDAEYWVWPNLRPLIENPIGDRLLVEAVNARFTAIHALLGLALLLSPAAAPKGTTHA